MNLNNFTLHYFVMSHIVEHGYAPKIDSIVQHFSVSSSDTMAALKALEENHGVVLHSESSEVWVMHPFSTAPTGFWVESNNGSWWGN